MNMVNSTDVRTHGAAEGRLPSIGWRFSDLWRAPLTDLPVRDELIRQYVPLSAQMNIMEIGPGSGFPAFRMAREVATLTLLEVAAGSAARLRGKFEGTPNVGVVIDDLCREGLGRTYACSADAIIAIDVFMFVSDPATALGNLAEMLRPRGSLFMAFPNYEVPDWPTFYRTRTELETHLRIAGFAEWEIYSLRLSPWSQLLYKWLHEVPLRLYRALQTARRKRPPRAQTYDETWAFQYGRGMEALKLPIHLYWATTMTLMRLGGDLFHRAECGEEIFRKNIFVVAHRGGSDGGIE
jgi:SAM-dependent methyltransferase